ncbi:MAG: HEPN domain-containing protein [Candidatus Omnitrophica bacterium]|nr:HEPN domain-containing protein [Candidatus Omnitrophota bacterium]
MPPETSASSWLRLAADDLKAARIMIRERLYHLACFHAQQAAEKGLKAYLVSRRGATPRSHHLAALLWEAVGQGLHGRTLDRACKILDQYYVPTRYPDALIGGIAGGLPGSTHAAEAVRLAHTILRAVRRAL